MPEKNRVSGMNRQSLSVAPYSVATLEFLDNAPNFFRIQNTAATGTIYVSTSTIPTTTNYDLAVGAGKLKLWTEPFRRSKVYLFNPTGSAITVKVVSFKADFEPLALALSEIEVTIPESIVQSSKIESFEAPLPAGGNKIGKVEISDPLPAGTNKIGKVEVSNSLSLSSSTVSSLTSSNNTKLDSVITKLDTIISKLSVGDSTSF